MTLWLASLIVAALLLGASGGAQDWERASQDVRRLEPSAFKQLPRAILENLQARRCTVPQSFAAEAPENVVQGHFTSKEHLDWAVLCSRQRVSTILVFRGGSTSPIDELESSPDSTFLQVIGPDTRVGFSRAITVADPRHIRAHAGDFALPPLDHDGIEDHFLEKGSEIWYWLGDRWVKFPGAD